MWWILRYDGRGEPCYFDQIVCGITFQTVSSRRYARRYADPGTAQAEAKRLSDRYGYKLTAEPLK